MKNLVLAVLLSFSVNCFADEWRTEDTQRETAYLVIAAMDWAQTRNIARNGDKCFRDGYSNCGETNFILGNTPSVDKVDAYFILIEMLGHYAVVNALPVEYRGMFQYITIGIEAGYVHHNLQLGIGIKF